MQGQPQEFTKVEGKAKFVFPKEAWKHVDEPPKAPKDLNHPFQVATRLDPKKQQQSLQVDQSSSLDPKHTKASLKVTLNRSSAGKESSRNRKHISYHPVQIPLETDSVIGRFRDEE